VFSWLQLGALLVAVPLQAQIDPRQMAGIPRPVDDLPDGSVSVRVIRGALTNNIPNQPVELRVGSEVLTVSTDAEGRAQFDNLTPGASVTASATVDGERLESQTFPAPARGGIRLLLVASGEGSDGPAAGPAVTGQVAIGGQTRIIMQPGDDTLTIYYLLEVVNNSPSPVNPATPFAFDLPAGATRSGLLPGSTALASLDGPRVQVSGPFPPGTTTVNVGTELAVTSGALEIEQRFPAPLQSFGVFVQKVVGDIGMSSPQIAEQREIAAQGEIYLAGAGAPVAPGQPLMVSVTGLPHHSPVPRRVTLALAIGILAAGVWAGWRPREGSGAPAADRKRLVARREKLLGELVRLERDHRGDSRFAARREELVTALEHVYGALDTDSMPPGSGTTAGAAA
jgi:hypothetical protein